MGRTEYASVHGCLLCWLRSAPLQEKHQVLGVYLGIGLMVAPVTMLIACFYYLSLIPLPLIGNAAYLLFAIIRTSGFILATKWSGRSPVARSTEKTGLITPSVKSYGSGIIPKLSWRQEQVVAAVELEEMPKSYAFQDSTSQPQEDMVPKFLSIVRHLTLTSVPFSLRFERRENTTRVQFLTWAKDDTLLYHQKTVLQDTLEGNLHGFRFQSCGYYEGLDLDDTLSAAAVEVSGIPLSIEGDAQRKDPMDVVAGNVQGLENGLVQVFVEPTDASDSALGSLESRFRRAVVSSETTITKEKSGLLSSDRQESKHIVDPRAMRKAELLKRQVERVSGKNLCKTQVMTASWAKRLKDADYAARRLAGGIMGALQPDTEQESFKVRFYRNQKDVGKLFSGLPIGSYSILTPSEATDYFILPKTDLGIRVTSRERFSSGTREAAYRPAAQASRTPSSAMYARRSGGSAACRRSSTDTLSVRVVSPSRPHTSSPISGTTMDT